MPVLGLAAASAVSGITVGLFTGAVDGPFLGGVAAVLTSIFTFVLGLVALLRANRKKPTSGDSAEAWRLLAELLLAQQKEHEKDADADD